MTDVGDNSANAAAPLSELLVEFDGEQVSIRSDDPRLLDFVRDTYTHMLVDAVTAAVGRIEVTPGGRGFSFRTGDGTSIENESVEPLLNFLKEEVIRQFMRSRKDLLWLHAGVAERDGRALVICGASGQGKSTLVTKLCENGWRLMSDDVAPLSMQADVVYPFPQAPSRRIQQEHLAPPEEIASLAREVVTIPPDGLGRDAAAVEAVIFPVYSRGVKANLTLLPQGTAALEVLRHTRNLVDHGNTGVGRAAGLGRAIPMYRLVYDLPDEAVAVLPRLL